ncbi:MAG TPA: trehalose-6-phosphate synthase [Acetobacteraceae bacterium]|nr:trehalose-6-phosphate synthase [Acetobacteraceae bacterium]
MNRLVVVSNRVPVPQGGAAPGGLAVALGGLMERRGGFWFGWSGGISDTEGELGIVRSGEVQYATVDLTRAEHEQYYNGFSNGVLWPLLHSMPELMKYDRRDAQAYREVNQRLVSVLVPQLHPSDVIWVHDYHLMAMPALLRAQGVVAPIGFFLHVPFPSADVFGAMPEASLLLRDLLAADLLGFHTDNDVENFALAAQRLAGATRISGQWLGLAGRRIRIGTFPVEIEAREFKRMAEQAVGSTPVQKLRDSLDGQRLVLGVDRLDPTKGLPQRIAGYRRLLEKRAEWRHRVTLLQIAPMSRKEVGAYQDLREELDRAAGAINGDWGEPDWLPLRLVVRPGARSTVAGYMRLAAIGLVTPLRDGMNLVAKEYIAAQDPQDPGVLVLSRFAGAAQQLPAALLVNPYAADELADALDRGLRMSLAERQERWQECWRAIERRTPLEWGRSFLDALLRAASAQATPSVRLGNAIVSSRAPQDATIAGQERAREPRRPADKRTLS